MKRTPLRKVYTVLGPFGIVLVLLSLGLTSCAKATPTYTPSPTNTPTPTTSASPTMMPTATNTPAGSNVTIDLVAKNIAFDLNTITVPAGAQVTVNFKNDDSGIPHNFSVYMTSAAQDEIFKGQIINGVSSITYQFTAPTTPGNYFFRCDVHPTQMTGTFVVQ